MTDTVRPCDRCGQRRPLNALFAFVYGPQPWDASEHRAVLCVPCHGAATEQVECIEQMAAGAVDGDPRTELEAAFAEAALFNTVLNPAKARATKEN